MDYIRYRTFSDGEWDYVYCIKFDIEKFYYVKPVVYEWLKKLGRLDLLTSIVTENQPYFVYETHQKLNHHQPKMDESIMNYPVPEDHLEHIVGIASFFYEFRYPHKELSLSDHFERSMKCIFPKIPKEVFESMLSYQLSQYEYHSSYGEVKEKIHEYLENNY